MYVNKHEVHPPYKREKNPKLKFLFLNNYKESRMFIPRKKDVYPEHHHWWIGLVSDDRSTPQGKHMSS
jgi:hypothetical protein